MSCCLQEVSQLRKPMYRGIVRPWGTPSPCLHLTCHMLPSTGPQPSLILKINSSRTFTLLVWKLKPLRQMQPLGQNGRLEPLTLRCALKALGRPLQRVHRILSRLPFDRERYQRPGLHLCRDSWSGLHCECTLESQNTALSVVVSCL